MTEPIRNPEPQARPVPVEPVDPAVLVDRAPTGAATKRGPVARPRSGPEQTRRVLVFGFGIIQLLIGLRIVLVLIAARQDNAIVATILDASDFFVAPFRGILQTNVAESGAVVLDLAAVVALVGWTILEVMLYWAIGLFRRDPV